MVDGRYAYLGTAVEYPITLIDGKESVVGGIEVINSSITKILSTPVGSRLFLREYGSRINELIFEPNDAILLRLLRTNILGALTKWETRAKFLDVNMSTGDDMVLCDIKYRILRSNEFNSFVYPIYKSLIW